MLRVTSKSSCALDDSPSPSCERVLVLVLSVEQAMKATGKTFETSDLDSVDIAVDC